MGEFGGFLCWEEVKKVNKEGQLIVRWEEGKLQSCMTSSTLEEVIA